MQNNEYLSRFAHELRNPLTLICSSLQLLEKECPAVRESDLWEQIRKDLSDVIRLLKDLSVPFDRIHAEPLNAGDFLSGLCASFAPSMKLRGISFATELADSLHGITLMADGQKLRQSVTNLVLNAIDAVSGQSVPGRIVLSAAADRSSLSIHIRDNGPGIPQEYLSDLFEPFVTHKAGGTGLGLGIARMIAEQHGGSLTLETHCASADAPEAFCSEPQDSSVRIPGTESSASFTDFCLRLPLPGGPR